MSGKITREELSQQFNQEIREYTEHLNNFSNPHYVTKEQVGLGNVDNMSALSIRGDSNKQLRVEVVSSVGSHTPTIGRLIYVQNEGKIKVGNGLTWV